ncbi:MAG: flippase-like domain-containing protein [Chloroflexi bacterium]|nr:flippase-like domain-containing protein [Chloroflexota bacterium]
MRYLRAMLGLAISAACVIALLTQIDPQRTWQSLSHARPGWLLATVGVLLLSMLVKAWRWGVLFYPTRGLRLQRLFSALAIGYLVLSVVPMRLGELVRAYLIGRTEPVAFTQAVGTILVEKILDVLTILAFLALLGLFMPLPVLGVPNEVLVGLGLGGVGGLLILAWLPRQRILALLARLQLYLPGSRRFNLVRMIGPFLDAVAILRYPRVLPVVVLSSALTWSLAALINYLGLQALAIEAPVAAAIWLMIVTNLVMILPSAPGYVGVFHKFSVIALAAFAIDANEAAAYAIVLHALIYGTFIALGLIFVWRGGYRWRDLWPGTPPAAAPASALVSPQTAGTDPVPAIVTLPEREP